MTCVTRGGVPLTKLGCSARRFAAAGVAIAAALALVVYLSTAGGSDESQTLSDDASGITVSYPREWDVQQFAHYCRRNGPGLLVSSVREHRFQNSQIPNGCTNQWDLRGLPSDFVLVDVSLFASPFPRPGPDPETAMPLELARFERNPDGVAFTRVVRQRNEYSVRVWFGATTSRADQDAAADVIRSIQFGDPSTP